VYISAALCAAAGVLAALTIRNPARAARAAAAPCPMHCGLDAPARLPAAAASQPHAAR
jgi:hypothetical protein